MTRRTSLYPSPGRARWRIALAVVCLGGMPLSSPARAQLIALKASPLADGDQFAFFPTANRGMGGVSIALADSLLDPFVNPAKGARLGRPRLFTSPSLFSASERTGGGQTLPLG